MNDKFAAIRTEIEEEIGSPINPNLDFVYVCLFYYRHAVPALLVEVDRLEADADADATRAWLADIDTASLPNDFSTSEMAKIRMQTLKERTLEGLGLIGKIERLEAELAQCRREKNDLVLKAYPAMDERDRLEAENKRMREALEKFARQKLTNEMDPLDVADGDYEGAYDYIIADARATLQEKQP